VSSENTERLHSAYAALRRRDLDGFLEYVHPAVQFTSLITESDGVVYRGHAGVRKFLDSLLAVLPNWQVFEDRVEDYGDAMLVKARSVASGAGSGVSVEQAMWQALRMSDGQVVAWGFFRTEEEALDAIRAWRAEQRSTERRGSEPAREAPRLAKRQ
jgi:ketosteroid isomerase-like protein